MGECSSGKPFGPNVVTQRQRTLCVQCYYQLNPGQGYSLWVTTLKPSGDTDYALPLTLSEGGGLMVSHFTRQLGGSLKTYVLHYVNGVHIKDVKEAEIQATREWEARDKLHNLHQSAWILSCKLKEVSSCAGSPLSRFLASEAAPSIKS